MGSKELKQSEKIMGKRWRELATRKIIKTLTLRDGVKS